MNALFMMLGVILGAVVIGVLGLDPWVYAGVMTAGLTTGLLVRGVYELGKQAARKETDL